MKSLGLGRSGKNGGIEGLVVDQGLLGASLGIERDLSRLKDRQGLTRLMGTLFADAKNAKHRNFAT